MAKLSPKRLTVCQLFIIVLIGCWCHQQVSAAGVTSNEEEVNGTISTTTTTSTTVSSANPTPESIATSGDYGWLNEADCGRRLVRYPKIINGSTAVHGHYPWIVSLQLNNRHHCGGSLIRSDWVLTAAHCVYRMTANRFKIKVGGHRRNASAELTSVTVQPVFATAHQGFSFATFADDLALLKLPYKLKYTNYIQPICLPEFHEISATSAVVVSTANSINSTKIRLITSSNNIVPQSSSSTKQPPKEATVIGWGKLKQGGFSAELLQELLVPIVDNNQCRRWYQEKAKMLAIRPTQICAGLEEGGKDACQGDSGSPMLITDPETKRSEIIGIVSAGIGCALPKLPGLYTRVSAYGRWISETIEKYDKIFPSLVTTSSTTTTTTEAPATTTTETLATTTEAPSTTDQYPFPTVTFPSTIKWPVNIELAPNGTVIIPANRP